jgi:hypothetical protein
MLKCFRNALRERLIIPLCDFFLDGAVAKNIAPAFPATSKPPSRDEA